VVVDANHPLAGETLRFEVRVLDVRPATADEIAEAEADIDEHEGGCCDDPSHDHGDAGDGAGLVELGRKAKDHGPS
jgi:FKBP-type peptidyl-prolyl cis-trans isomerase SlyD